MFANKTIQKFTSDLLAFGYRNKRGLGSFEEPTAAWAECIVDVMDQVQITFYQLQYSGFGRSLADYETRVYLKANRVGRRVEFVIEEDGFGYDCVIEHVWDQTDENQWDALIDESFPGNARGAFDAIMDIVRDDIQFTPLTMADEKRLHLIPVDGSLNKGIRRLAKLRNVSMTLRHSYRLISEQFSAHRGLVDMVRPRSGVTAYLPVTPIPTAPTTSIRPAGQSEVG